MSKCIYLSEDFYCDYYAGKPVTIDCHDSEEHPCEHKWVSSEDVVVMKHGKWIEKEDGFGDTYYDCSCCGESFCLIEGTPADNMYNYCPNCGAYMRGGT